MAAMKRVALLLPLLMAAGAALAQTSPELALRALQEGFPGRTGEIAFIDGDWTIAVNGEIFFWANGRLLPCAYRHRYYEFGSHSFYMVAQAPTPPSEMSPEHVERLRYAGAPQARQQRRDVHRAFQAALFGGSTRAEIEALQRRIEFLGFPLTVHRDIVAALGRVEAEIMAWEGGEAFVATLGRAYGFVWREIAGTQRMSFHSWGLAVDILPTDLRGRAVFWQWELPRNPNWMLIPLEDRWSPPPPVVEAFERQGFIWGGKWAFFDTMHFEFRPELHAFTRLLGGAPPERAEGRSLRHVYPDSLLR